jgi:phage terminase large subunit GpA-like protein
VGLIVAISLVIVRSFREMAIATKREWKREHVRNEPLDCRVYALAARLSLGINMDPVTTFSAVRPSKWVLS